MIENLKIKRQRIFKKLISSANLKGVRMRKYLFFIICLAPGLVVTPLNTFAAAKIKISQVTPKIVKQNDIKMISIKGAGFQKGAGLDLGNGITVLSANITTRKIKAQITVG